MTSLGGINGVQKVDLPKYEFGDQRSTAKDKYVGDSTVEVRAASASLTQKEELSAFDLGNLKEEEKKKLDEELKKMNDTLASSGKVLKFKYDEKAKATYVEVIDAESQKVLASLPPEFLIDLSVRMKELIGMFLDERL
ncbi:flagellar protein FlaG [Cohnella cholangitidis]|uniref:Flagellar protein FlaG n=1 Tax=Cohnella cholangitidis TaxID=2598458 RepID=A0A7G5BXJ4_9BACL|nr:flagellar protein FlaG [Cohnella cholangitidis]QMV41678.1 flagellar protein FlaG [Cohnella cholangitidis]